MAEGAPPPDLGPDPGPGAAPRPRRRKRDRAKKGAVWTLRILGTLAFVVILVFFFLTRTDRGALLTVGQILERLPLNGEITVEDVRSRRLLEGVRLYGVRITGPEGRLFLQADSALLRYDWRTFLSGDVVFSTLHVWTPRAHITRYPGEEEFNAARIFVSEEEADTLAGASPPRRVIFRDVRLAGTGTVEVLFPIEGEPPERALTVPSPVGEGLLRRLSFIGLGAVLPEVVLSSPEAPGQRVRVDSLEFTGRIFDKDPMVVRQLAGDVRYSEGRVDVDAERLALEGSRIEGSFFAELPPEDDADAELRWGFSGTADPVELDDLRWVDPRLPPGVARGGMALVASGGEIRMTFRELDVASEGTDANVNGRVVLAEGAQRFDEFHVHTTPVALSRLEPWLAEPLPVEGSVDGQFTLNGTPASLGASGVLTLRGGGRSPTTADFSGTFHLGDEGFGFTDLEATLDPVDFALAEDLFEGVEFGGRGRIDLQASGRLDDAIRFRADIDHRDEGVPASDVLARGSVRRLGGEMVLDVTADVSPLSFTALRRWYPDLPVTGEVQGSIRANGPLSDLSLVTDLDTEAGRLALESRFDATNPGGYYSVEGTVEDFRLSRIVPGLPNPTVFTGWLDVEGRGLDPATATVRGRLRARASRVGGLHVDTATVAFAVDRGTLSVDTLDAVLGGVAVQAEGTLAMTEAQPSGTVTVAFQSDSLGRLRPLFLGDTVIAGDTLNALERQLLEVEGVDTDTLPDLAEVRVAGRVTGEATLTGSLERFSAEGEAFFGEVAYGQNLMQGATVSFTGTELPGLGGTLSADIRADSLVLLGREFAGADVDVEYTQPEGRVEILLERHEREDYRARAVFELDTLGGRVRLEEMALRFDSLRWELQGPATVAWNDRGIRVDDLVLERPGEDPLRVEADGLLPTEGEADFTLSVEGLRLQRVAQVLQREDLELAGNVDLDLRITGDAASPLITGTVLGTGVEYATVEMSRVSVEVDYRDRSLGLDLSAWDDSLRVLTAEGTIPVDLSLQEVADRTPDASIDLDVVADSLPAQYVLGYLQNIQEVSGTLSGRFRVGGTVEDPSPEGTVVLNDAGWFLEDLGVRYDDVEGTLELQPDGTVTVDARARSDGTAVVTGTVALDPLTNPTFDLDIRLSGFQAVDRRDVQGQVSGTVELTSTYDRPLVTGDLTVDQGELFLEEFVRAAGVVDLTDPRFFDVVDTTLFSAEPLLEAGPNPFMRNLRVDIDMEVAGDTWLRSEDMNVEIAGDLIVAYDRGSRDLVLVGQLDAVRGSYSVLGRRFEVEQGVVEFVGTPGINPQLDITASTRLRQPGGDPLNILATVSGTLENPRVQLSSEEQAVAQSDLVSYLVFGRPSYELASGEARIVEGAAGSLVGAAYGAGVSVLSGSLANHLSAQVAQQWGLDYFAITQAGNLGLTGGSFASSFNQTVVEAGRYISDEVFLTLLFRPFGGSESGSQFPGVRMEWQIDDYWTMEGFWEERFLRSQTVGFSGLAYRTDRVGGIFIFREWGY